jgi:hypothetical protein
LEICERGTLEIRSRFRTPPPTPPPIPTHPTPPAPPHLARGCRGRHAGAPRGGYPRKSAEIH